MLHRLEPTSETLHGHFSRDLAPALTVDPGDRVEFRCLDSKWGLEPHNGENRFRNEFPRPRPDFDQGHALTGPVYIRGAKPGQVLSVRIEEIVIGDWGQTYVGGFPSAWNEELGIVDEGIILRWTFDKGRKVARNDRGHEVDFKPFMGIYGMPTNEPGILPTVPPRRTGGNLDCKELVAGATLYLPIEVEGGLFSTGDGHAAQGDGEVSSTAIECPMERVVLTFDLVDEFSLTMPIASTPVGWVAMGLDEDLNVAHRLAIEHMTALLMRLHGVSKLEAIGLAGVCVDFRVTQSVNRVRGVHGVLPHGAIRFGSG